ncbi:MAG: hypothetical protein ACE5DL_06290 [Nitrosopumilaceae archaeon]
MRKKIIPIVLTICFTFFSTHLYAENKQTTKAKADAAAAGSYHATAVSMVFWGVLLASGIAAAAILVDASTSHS